MAAPAPPAGTSGYNTLPLEKKNEKFSSVGAVMTLIRILALTTGAICSSILIGCMNSQNTDLHNANPSCVCSIAFRWQDPDCTNMNLCNFVYFDASLVLIGSVVFGSISILSLIRGVQLLGTYLSLLEIFMVFFGSIFAIIITSFLESLYICNSWDGSKCTASWSASETTASAMAASARAIAIVMSIACGLAAPRAYGAIKEVIKKCRAPREPQFNSFENPNAAIGQGTATAPNPTSQMQSPTMWGGGDSTA
eukprot:m.224578 g.224578  ORF g.224578 m.224578 type:complete len:252 (-) comp11112_c0_seq1:114-869(-)